MKKHFTMVAVVFLVFTQFAHAAGGFRNDSILATKCYEVGASGSGSYESPASAADGDIFKIPANAVLEAVHVTVVTAITGTTPQVNVGDDDDADGWVADASVTEATPAVYVGAGAYASSNKHYSAAGKELKLDVTGTLSAGKFCVAAKGYRL